ncbi:Poly(rC)-binding protein 2 [Coemansia sp. RSA 2703]|nr:Poly(rC)-binding protein 2 [Coemansia sp. RSA 2703]
MHRDDKRTHSGTCAAVTSTHSTAEHGSEYGQMDGDDVLAPYESDFEPVDIEDNDEPAYMLVASPSQADAASSSPSSAAPSTTTRSAPLALRIVFPSDIGGVLIGRSGRHINKLKQSTHATWHVSTGGAKDDRLVTLSGTPTTIAQAVRTLAEHIVDQTPRSSSSSSSRRSHDHPGTPSSATTAPQPDDMLTLNLLFPAKTIGQLLGPSGERLQHVRQLADVHRLHITRDPLPYTHERIVQVTATPDGLRAAAGALLQATDGLLGAAQSAATLYRPVADGLRSFLRMDAETLRDGGKGRKRSRSTTERPAQRASDDGGKRRRTCKQREMTEKMVVADAAAGWLIGRNGRRIAEVVRRSGADVRLSPRVRGMADRVVTITGAPHRVSDARRRIERTVHAFERGNTSD